MLSIVLTVLCLCLLSGSVLSGKGDFETMGVLTLDSITYPRLVPNPQLDLVFLISNKAEIGNYGTDSIRADFLDFAEKALRRGTSETVLFAQILVNGAENLMLTQRITGGAGIKHPKMFVVKRGTSTPIAYPDSGAFNTPALTSFVSRYLDDFFVPTPGLIEKLSAITKKFVHAHSSEYEGLIQEAEAEVPALTPEGKEFAKYNIKLMNKVKDSGLDSVRAEIARLEAIVRSDNLSPKKKSDIQAKLNIALQFDVDEREL